MWNPSVVQGPFDWPDLFGYHLNVQKGYLPSAAGVAKVNPTSPEVIWSGDRGRPAKLPVFDAEGDKIGSTPNPEGAAPYTDTWFLLFTDEAEARSLMPNLWVEPVTLRHT